MGERCPNCGEWTSYNSEEELYSQESQDCICCMEYRYECEKCGCQWTVTEETFRRVEIEVEGREED